MSNSPAVTAPAELLPDVPVIADSISVELPPVPAKRGHGRPRKYPLLTASADIEPGTSADITAYLQDHRLADIIVYLQDTPANNTQFKASRQKEINGLLEKGVFEVIPATDVPQGIRLFNSRFVDDIKYAGTEKAFEKSRLVVQAYNNQNKTTVLT
jgi:hypothetical protein